MHTSHGAGSRRARPDPAGSAGGSAQPTTAPGETAARGLPAEAAALVGAVLEDRYRVDEPMARGGMSTVYRGVDLRLDRPVAIKVMTPAYAADPTFLARFEREARAAAKLDDPHVVGVFDQGRDGEQVFLVMELVDGGTLRDVLTELGDLSVRQTLSILEPILGALAAAHRAGLVHRDVKPENVLISLRGDVKVADFGLVRAVSSTTMATGDVILGTVAYLSPEQVETGASDERSDVYAAGIVAYEMLSGHPPFTGDNALSVAYQHVHSQVPPVADAAPGVPVSIAEIIDSATSHDPLHRPANAGEFLRRIRAARSDMGLSLVPVPIPKRQIAAPVESAPRETVRATAIQSSVERPVRAADAPTPGQLRRRRRRRIRLIATLVVVLLAAGAAVGGWWLASRWTATPAVAELPEHEAVLAVTDAGLVADITTEPNNVVPSGVVIAIDPPADTRQRTGATVELVVSSGRPVIPEIAAGTPRDQAVADLRAAGFEPATSAAANEYDDVLAAGSVVRTEPRAGVLADLGSRVTLVLSRGPQPLTVPEVAGKLAEDAQNKLIVAGFTLGPIRTVFDAEVPAGTVIGTDPGSGDSAPRGASVSLVLAVSKTVPDLGDGSIDAVTAALEHDGFEVIVGDGEFDPQVPGGDVVRIEPTPGTRLDPANPVVTLIVSTSVTTPPVTGLNVGDAKRVLAAHGLESTVRSLFGSDRSIVSSQLPEAGQLVEPASTVRLDAWP